MATNGCDTGCMDNRSPEVEAWFETYDNPQKELVRAVRSVILDVDSRMSEAIKWKAPTFMFRGNLASFYPRSTKHVALMFHTGASVPDPTGLLDGEGARPGSRASPTPRTSPARPTRCATLCEPGSAARNSPAGAAA